ncbi:MAG TPA: hypothetical protein VMT34_16900, partial [Aggregatilineales bacterium]|nr:hypothetical protein [Aggregatilineales bacterium]
KEVDTLANDKRIATYTISGKEGDTITLRASMKDFHDSSAYLGDTELLLVDANNEPIEIQREITDYGYVLRVYQLTGPGPYKLYLIPQRTAGNQGSWNDGFYPQHQFNLALSNGDDLLFDRGTLLPGQPVLDTFDPNNGTKRASYRIGLDEGKDMTLRLATPNGQSTPPLHGQVRVVDADDQILASTALSYDQNALLISYHLVGTAPYRFIMDTYGDYAVTLSDGDLIQNDFGSLAYDQTANSTLKAPQAIAAYSIDGKEGDLISIKIEAPRRFVQAYLDDSKRALISPDNQASAQGTTVYVYTLTGPGPYRLRLFYPGTSPYKVTLTGGGKDILSAQLGGLTVNPKSDDPKFKPVTVTAKLDAPARFANYTFDGKDGDLITLDLNSNGGDKALEPVVHNQEGQEIAPQVSVVDRTHLLAVYKLHGGAPYALAFETTNQWVISLTAADMVRADAGPLPTGPQDKPYSNELPKPAIVAVHQLDVAPGELITIQVQNSNRTVDLQVHDGSGALLRPEATDFQNGNNVYVFILSGVGPYTTQFVVSGKYTASVQAGNLLRVDGGTVKFNEPTDGQLGDPGRVTTFVIDGKRNQIVTIQLQADGQAQGGEFRDANGKQWDPTFQFTRNNQQYAVYQLSGPAPYTFTFAGKKYTLLVDSGDALRAELGDVPFEQSITSTLTAPAVTAVYTVPGQPGEQVSFQLQDRGQPVDSDLFDADHKPLKRDALVTKNSTAISVYTLSGKGPYSYEFLTQGPYKLTATQGNALNAQLATLPMGQKVTNTLPAPAENAFFTIDGQPGQTITIELQAGNKPQGSHLTNGQGKELIPQAKLDRNNFTYTVFVLSGPPPYTLTFNTTQQYSVTASRDNTIRAEVGVVRFDNTVTNTLKAPAALAVHTIDAQPGQTITIRLQDQNQPIDSQLVDADGNLLSPIGKAVANNATYTIYTLSGTAPYRVSFLPKGQYSIKLTRGNIYRTDLGSIPFGTKKDDQLQAPAITGVYTLDTAPDQTISVLIVSRGQQQFILGELRGGDGKVIEPMARQYNGSNTTAYVYRLTGAGPYQFAFQTNQPYEIEFMRGDLGETQFDIYPTVTPTPTPVP